METGVRCSKCGEYRSFLIRVVLGHSIMGLYVGEGLEGLQKDQTEDWCVGCIGLESMRGREGSK